MLPVDVGAVDVRPLGDFGVDGCMAMIAHKAVEWATGALCGKQRIAE